MKRFRNSHTSHSLTFIVPGLLDPVPYLDQLPVNELPDLTVFSKMLSRGNLFIPEHLNDKHNNFYQCLISKLGLSDAHIDATSHSSIARYSYFAETKNDLLENNALMSSVDFEQLAQDKWVMRADPSFMVADRDQLVLARSGKFNLSLTEAKTLVDEINHFYSDMDEENFWTLKLVSPERWYIISDKPIRMQSVPPENALGQSIKPFLLTKNNSSGNEDSAHWINLFNEFQMILHQSTINKKRLSEKKLTVNSVWFWGNESLTDNTFTNDLFYDPARPSETMVYSNNSFVQKFSAWLGATCSSLPEKYVYSTDNPAHNILYTMEEFNQTIRAKDIFTWVGLLEQFEKNYLVPIERELDSGNIAQVEFISPSGICLVVNKKSLKHWWRKKKSFYLFYDVFNI